MIYMINWSLAMSDSMGDGYELYTVFAITGLVLLVFYGVRFFNFYNESFKVSSKINIYNIFIARGGRCERARSQPDRRSRNFHAPPQLAGKRDVLQPANQSKRASSPRECVFVPARGAGS